ARVAGEIRLCFDADRAGEEAAWRTVEAASGLPVHLAVVPLPNGQDPGAMAASPNEQSALLCAVDGRNPLLTWLIATRVARAGRALEGLPAEAFEEPAHRRAFDLLASGALRSEEWPEELRPLAAELRADAVDGAAEGELREAAHRVQEAALQRRAATLRDRGDERGYLATLDLLRRLRA